MRIPYHLSQFSGMIQRLLFQILAVMLLGMPMNRLEVILLFVDDFFFQHARARSKTEELVGDFRCLRIMLFLFFDSPRSALRIGPLLTNLLRVSCAPDRYPATGISSSTTLETRNSLGAAGSIRCEADAISGSNS